MHFSAVRLSVALVAILFAAAIAEAQCPVMPTGFLCITQEAGNQAAANARENAALKNENAVLKQSLIEKDKNTEVIREGARKNEADLKEALTKTQTELANKTGQLIGAEATITRQTAIIDLLLKYARPKKFGLINF